MHQSLHILKKKNSDVAIFRQLVPRGHQNIAGFFLKITFFLTFSQIWLIPLVNDLQHTTSPGCVCVCVCVLIQIM
jgi:hypothetical protein